MTKARPRSRKQAHGTTESHARGKARPRTRMQAHGKTKARPRPIKQAREKTNARPRPRKQARRTTGSHTWRKPRSRPRKQAHGKTKARPRPRKQAHGLQGVTEERKGLAGKYADLPTKRRVRVIPQGSKKDAPSIKDDTKGQPKRPWHRKNGECRQN